MPKLYIKSHYQNKLAINPLLSLKIGHIGMVGFTVQLGGAYQQKVIPVYTLIMRKAKVVY